MNALLVFQKVYELLNMTHAASNLGLTQPGISQHIQALERSLGEQLFLRQGRKLIPTSFASELYKNLKVHLTSIDNLLVNSSDLKNKMSGIINIGVPIEFGNNMVFPLLRKFSEKYPHIIFKVKYGLAPEMNKYILDGELDFAFIDGLYANSYVSTNVVYREELVLCCTSEYFHRKTKLPNDNSKKFFEQFEYAAYLEDHSILKDWFIKSMNLKSLKLKVLLQTEDAQGVYTFIRESMGVGVIPRHMIKKASSNQYHVFDSPTPVLNDIKISYIESRVVTPQLKAFLEHISENLTSKFISSSLL